MTELRRLERQDAARLSALWGGGEPLIGYRLPENEEELAALIDEWNRGEARGAYFEMLLIEEDGEPAGLVSLFGRGKDVSFGISVHPRLQRRGIGRRAALLAADHARTNGWACLISECRTDNRASMALHEGCGFRRTGERINAKGNSVICWEMTLRPGRSDGELK